MSSEDQKKTFTGKAIVTRDTLANNGWKIEEVTTREFNDDELVVEMVASGVCHTDVLCGSGELGTSEIFFYPRVLGHEGSGYVKAVGSKVTVAKPGDAVLLSFDFCDSCQSCKDGLPSLCYESMPLNFGDKTIFTSAKSGETGIGGQFFGQSSFARYSVVRQTGVVNATNLIKSKEELQMFAPLGCGLQTGAGTVVNVAKASSGDSIAVLGLGGVGLSAIMAAKLSDCARIIAVDRVPSRLQLAKEMGATHLVDTSKEDLVDVVHKVCDGVGPHVTIDTTGVPALIKSAIEMTRKGGKIIQVGSTPPDFKLEIPTFLWMNSGKSYLGAIEGNSISSIFIPQMIKWYREGKFPFDKLIKLMPVEDFEKGVHEMHTGETVKPVITWS